MDQTPLTVGSPQQVIDRTLGLPRRRRRLPAPAVPRRPRRAAARGRAGADGHARRAGPAGPPQGVRRAARAERPRGASSTRACTAAAAGRAAGRSRRMTTGAVPLARRRQRRASASHRRPASWRIACRQRSSGISAKPASIPAFGSIELRDHAQDLANHLLTGFPSPRLQAALDAVLGADGLIAVTPIFSASYSGLFKLFFDLVERDGFAGKPVLIARDGRDRAPFPRGRARDPAAVRVPQRRGRRDRRVRRDRGLGPQRTTPRTAASSSGSIVPPRELAAAMAAPGAGDPHRQVRGPGLLRAATPVALGSRRPRADNGRRGTSRSGIPSTPGLAPPGRCRLPGWACRCPAGRVSCIPSIVTSRRSPRPATGSSGCATGGSGISRSWSCRSRPTRRQARPWPDRRGWVGDSTRNRIRAARPNGPPGARNGAAPPRRGGPGRGRAAR